MNVYAAVFESGSTWPKAVFATRWDSVFELCALVDTTGTGLLPEQTITKCSWIFSFANVAQRSTAYHTQRNPRVAATDCWRVASSCVRYESVA